MNADLELHAVVQENKDTRVEMTLRPGFQRAGAKLAKVQEILRWILPYTMHAQEGVLLTTGYSFHT